MAPTFPHSGSACFEIHSMRGSLSSSGVSDMPAAMPEDSLLAKLELLRLHKQRSLERCARFVEEIETAIQTAQRTRSHDNLSVLPSFNHRGRASEMATARSRQLELQQRRRRRRSSLSPSRDGSAYADGRQQSKAGCGILLQHYHSTFDPTVLQQGRDAVKMRNSQTQQQQQQQQIQQPHVLCASSSARVSLLWQQSPSIFADLACWDPWAHEKAIQHSVLSNAGIIDLHRTNHARATLLEMVAPPRWLTHSLCSYDLSPTCKSPYSYHPLGDSRIRSLPPSPSEHTDDGIRPELLAPTSKTVLHYCIEVCLSTKSTLVTSDELRKAASTRGTEGFGGAAR